MPYTGITGTVPGANGDQGVVCGANLDLSGVLPAGQVGNCFSADGQLWIGSTALSAGGTHCILGNITGSGGVTVTNSSGGINIAGSGPSTDLHAPRFIVASSTLGTGANFTTIASAIAAAQGTGINSTIFLQPGTYTENLTLVPGINLTAFPCDASELNTSSNVIINGKLTLSTVGTVSISGIQLQTNSDFCLVNSGSVASIITLDHCYINALNNTAISFTSSSASSKIVLNNCYGNLATTGIALFSSSSAGYLAMYHCNFQNTGSSTTASTSTGTGTVDIQYSYLLNPISLTTSSTFLSARFSAFDCQALNTTAVSLAGTGNSNIYHCNLTAGTASALSVGTGTTCILSLSNITSTNTNAITGGGTLSYNNIDFIGPSSPTFTINTTTQIPFVASNDAIGVVTPGAYPYTTVPQDGLILVDTTAAHTIVPLASPTKGQKHILKDATGTAATFNITVTPSGKNIDGAASTTINQNFASITIIYNGTQWNIV